MCRLNNLQMLTYAAGARACYWKPQMIAACRLHSQAPVSWLEGSLLYVIPVCRAFGCRALQLVVDLPRAKQMVSKALSPERKHTDGQAQTRHGHLM